MMLLYPTSLNPTHQHTATPRILLPRLDYLAPLSLSSEMAALTRALNPPLPALFVIFFLFELEF